MNLFITFAVVVIIGYAVLRRSGEKNEKKFWQEYYKKKDPPAHGWVDNRPSLSAWAWCFLFAVVGAFIIAKMGGF